MSKTRKEVTTTKTNQRIAELEEQISIKQQEISNLSLQIQELESGVNAYREDLTKPWRVDQNYQPLLLIKEAIAQRDQRKTLEEKIADVVQAIEDCKIYLAALQIEKNTLEEQLNKLQSQLEWEEQYLQFAKQFEPQYVPAYGDPHEKIAEIQEQINQLKTELTTATPYQSEFLQQRLSDLEQQQQYQQELVKDYPERYHNIHFQNFVKDCVALQPLFEQLQKAQEEYQTALINYLQNSQGDKRNLPDFRIPLVQSFYPGNASEFTFFIRTNVL